MVGACGLDRCYKCVKGAGDYFICQNDPTGTFRSCAEAACGSSGCQPPSGQTYCKTTMHTDDTRCVWNSSTCTYDCTRCTAPGYCSMSSGTATCVGGGCTDLGSKCDGNNQCYYNVQSCQWDCQPCSSGKTCQIQDGRAVCATGSSGLTSVKIGIASGNGTVQIKRNGTVIQTFSFGYQIYDMDPSDNLIITAVGSSGYTFDKWCNSSGGNCSTGDVNRTVGTGALDYMAYFKVVTIPQYTVNMTIVGSGSVTISSGTRATETVSGSNTRTYSQFDDIHYTANAASGYQFTSYNIDGNIWTATPYASIAVINANKNVTVTFTKIATGTIVLNSVQWVTPGNTLSKIRLNVTTNGSTSTYLKVDADANKTLIYNSTATYIDTTDFYTTAIPHGVCIGTPTPTQCKNLEAVISDKCAGVVCSPATKCVSRDLYSVVCDPGTGNCVQGILIQANSDKCGGTTPTYYRCDNMTGRCIADSTISSNQDNCTSLGQTCGGGVTICAKGQTNLGGLLPKCYSKNDVYLVGGAILLIMMMKK